MLLWRSSLARKRSLVGWSGAENYYGGVRSWWISKRRSPHWRWLFEQIKRHNRLIPQVEALEAERAVKEANQSFKQVSAVPPEAVHEGLIGVTEEETTRLASLSGTLAGMEKVELAVITLRREQTADENSLGEGKQDLIVAEQQRRAFSSLRLLEPHNKPQLKHMRDCLEPRLPWRMPTSAAPILWSRRTPEEIKAAEKQVAASLAAFVSAKAGHDLLTTAWIASTAANLAMELEDGLPCPVCGAQEHPPPPEDGGCHPPGGGGRRSDATRL